MLGKQVAQFFPSEGRGCSSGGMNVCIHWIPGIISEADHLCRRNKNGCHSLRRESSFLIGFCRIFARRAAASSGRASTAAQPRVAGQRCLGRPAGCEPPGLAGAPHQSWARCDGGQAAVTANEMRARPNFFAATEGCRANEGPPDSSSRDRGPANTFWRSTMRE